MLVAWVGEARPHPTEVEAAQMNRPSDQRRPEGARGRPGVVGRGSDGRSLRRWPPAEIGYGRVGP